MTIKMIAAMGLNSELGKDNNLLWRMPADMKHFKELTTGHTIVMGRKTAESLGSPLPNRKNVVLSRSGWVTNGFFTEHSVEDIIEHYGKQEDTWIIGGAEIYELFAPYAMELYLTLVHGKFPDADTFFPVIEKFDETWAKTCEESHFKDEKHPCDYTFLKYLRKR